MLHTKIMWDSNKTTLRQENKLFLTQTHVG